MSFSAILHRGRGRGGNQALAVEEAQRRARRFADDSLWNHDGEMAQRRYASYEAYVEHQASKLDGITDQLTRKQPRDLADFLQRFTRCTPLREARTVLCLGARLGTEVKALRQLGYLAIGIDLNPGDWNVYVMHGDFHNLAFPAGSFDAVYTNALDHAFDLSRIVAEVRRVLKPGGLFVVDLVYGSDEGGMAGDFEALSWRDSLGMVDRLNGLGPFELVETRRLDTPRKAGWRQVVLRRSATNPADGGPVVLPEPAAPAGGSDARRKRAGGRRLARRRVPILPTLAVATSCFALGLASGVILLKQPSPAFDLTRPTWQASPPT